MKIVKVKLPIYRTQIWFCITSKEVEAKRWFNKYSDSEFPKNYRGFTYLAEQQFPVILLKNIKDLSTICHEVTHAAWFILKECDIKLTEDNHEALTYLQSFIIENLLK